MHWNRWTTYSGFGGRLAPESVAAFDRITHLIGDGVNCTIAGQKTPEGYYNVERMLKSLAKRGEVAT